MQRSIKLVSMGCGSAIALLLGWFTPLPAVAQSATQESTPRAQLKVGVSDTPPFAIEAKTDSGSDWDGIGVHLW